MVQRRVQVRRAVSADGTIAEAMSEVIVTDDAQVAQSVVVQVSSNGSSASSVSVSSSLVKSKND